MTDREGNSPEMNDEGDMQRETAVTTEKEVTDKQEMFLLLGDSNLSSSRVTLNLDHLCLNNHVIINHVIALMPLNYCQR